ncbi:NAD(P)/FAD-dependent oxidoreductase [Roseateles sp. DXS20W]|uniref:NAD(P)/FAD-dependent oxidoreductase n=1 Tax=Pelomonas lactea TaxID=3299030 RepID=A0ABW7GG65_9BURK
MLKDQIRRVAVIGAGIAGAACAQALAQAGHQVQVFDKARGAGGRLATRRMAWRGEGGQPCETRLDHGTPGLAAHAEPFAAFVDQGLQAGWLAEWRPVLAEAGQAAGDDAVFHVPVPDNPELCRRLLAGVAATWSCAVDELQWRSPGWQLAAAGERLGEPFDAVVLALPPAQAAPLLGPHRSDWARHAALAPMQPCWTLMGVAAEHGAPAWTLARPAAGPLAWVMRNDARPGRQRVPGQAHWVAHARAGWSRQHLEQPPDSVLQQLQVAVDELLGRPVDWLHCTVHRWRYALPQPRLTAAGDAFWWDGAQGLGVCGDFLGGAGVEGAWMSAQSLAAAVRGWAHRAAEAA